MYAMIVPHSMQCIATCLGCPKPYPFPHPCTPPSLQVDSTKADFIRDRSLYVPNWNNLDW